MSTFGTRLTGIVLLLVAVVWTAGAFWLIPEGFGGGAITPRSFPVGLGVILGVLSVLLLAGTFAKDASDQEITAQPIARDRSSEIWAFASTFGFLIAYAMMLDWFGFVIATIVVSAGMLFFVLRSRSPAVLVGLPLGLTFGIWLVMGKLMGVYLPHGSLISGI